MSDMSFEEKLAKTKEILSELSNPEITMEQSLKLHKEGMKIVKQAQTQLDTARLQYEEFDKDKL
jgi:exodeoxyribonuclease VII small subunit